VWNSTQGSARSLLAAWTCHRPSWRGDVTREIDLIEEVARLHGLDKFPARLPCCQAAGRPPGIRRSRRPLRERLIGLGYREIITIPIVDEASDVVFRDANAGARADRESADRRCSVMRSTAW